MIHLHHLKAENGDDYKILLGYRDIMREFLPFYLDLSMFENPDEEKCLDVFWWGYLYYEAYPKESNFMMSLEYRNVKFDREGFVMEYGIDKRNMVTDLFRDTLAMFALDDPNFKSENKMIYEEMDEYANIFFFGLYQTYLIKNKLEKPLVD